MVKGIILGILSIIIGVSAYGQNLKIAMNDGTIYYGEGKVPKSSARVVNIKSNGEKLKLTSDDIAYILAWDKSKDSTESFKFIYTFFKDLKIIGKEDFRTSKNKLWLNERGRTEYLIFYYSSDKYKITEKGIQYLSSSSSLPPSRGGTFSYLQKTLDPTPVTVIKENLKKVGEVYFRECELVQEIVESMTYRSNVNQMFDEIIKAYTECVEEY